MLWWVMHSMTSTVADDLRARLEPPKVTILNHNMKISENEVWVVGEVRNDGADSDAGLRIGAAFYDKNKKLTDVGQAYINGRFPAGSVRAFKIKLGGCGADKKITVANYDHYDIEVH
jgi:hypothetical protein